jgi:hypothetical protein
LRSFSSLASGGVPRAVKRAGRAGGALNAGQARILAGDVVDGFEQCLLFQFSGVCASRAFLFLSVSSDLRTNAGIGRKVPFNFYNLTNIVPVGLASDCSLIEQIALYCCKQASTLTSISANLALSVKLLQPVPRCMRSGMGNGYII